MPTLVSQHPQTSAEKTLNENVYSPKASSCCTRGNVLGRDEVVGKGKGDS